MAAGLLDRLLLTEARIDGMAEGLCQLAALVRPHRRSSGHEEASQRPADRPEASASGVVGIIYEARPNVTADAFGLCFKTGNVVILKGGSDAIHSNEAIVACIRRSLGDAGLPEDAIQLITDTSRETTTAFMKMNEYVDVLIPRGGAGLIRAVVNNSTIPVIENREPATATSLWTKAPIWIWRLISF